MKRNTLILMFILISQISWGQNQKYSESIALFKNQEYTIAEKGFKKCIKKKKFNPYRFIAYFYLAEIERITSDSINREYYQEVLNILQSESICKAGPEHRFIEYKFSGILYFYLENYESAKSSLEKTKYIKDNDEEVEFYLKKIITR